jgi:hypothetical protein
MRVFLTGLAAMTISLLSASADAAEIYGPAQAAVAPHNRWYVGPTEPQSCFLVPDVIVALDALGPYCSSPRGSYPVRSHSHYGPYWRYGHYVPYYGY